MTENSDNHSPLKELLIESEDSMESKIINGLIPAAGLSSRMGAFKPLLPLRGKTLIENSIDSLIIAGVRHIVIVLGYRGRELESFLRRKYSGDRLIPTYNREFASTDMLHSIKMGLEVMPQCDAFFLLPGDMPVVSRKTYLALNQAPVEDEPSIIFPTLDGYRKHPPLIDSRFIDEIRDFHSDGGLREFWKLHTDNIKTVPVDDEGCWTDLDTYPQYEECLYRYSDSKE